VRTTRKRRNGRFSAGTRASWLAAALLLIAVTFTVYYNSLHNEFLFDDLETIVQAQTPGGAGPFAQLFNLLRTGRAYRPIRTASYAFDYALSGLDPWGYHLANIIYHALSSVFVFLIARSLFERARPALFAALLFAVHPIQTDAVTYLSGRRDVLSGLFVLMGFHAFLRYQLTSRRRYLALALPLYLLAFLSKESAIILPVLCFAYDVVARTRVRAPSAALSLLRDVWLGGRAAFREGRLIYLPCALLAGGMAYYVIFIVRGTWQQTYHGGSLWFTLLTGARIILHYVMLLIFPITLNADYSYDAFPVTTAWNDVRALAAALVLAALVCGLFACLRSRPMAALGGAWFFIALLPVSQIVPHHEMMAEHYLYLPSVGFCLLVSALLDPFLDHARFAPALYAGALAVLLLLALRTVWRNADWKDDLALWSKTVQTAPQAARARNNLGAAYLNRGQLARAEEQLEAALKISPDLAVAHANLGKIYMDRDDLQRAERELRAALERTRWDIIPRLWLGAVYARKGQMAEAERQFREALSRPPYDAYAYNNLGALFAKGGRLAEAESAFREALRRMPDLVEARDNLDRLRRLQERSEKTEDLVTTGVR
jgi:Tfp pilus assembly protein PilF